MSHYVDYHRSDGVAEIIFNRPEKKNALTLAMYQQATEFLQLAAEDPQIRVVLFRGEGDSFCAGNDLNDFAAAVGRPDTLKTIVTFLHSIAAFEKPLLAAVQGDAVGIGTTLLLHCDLVIAADTLKCQMPFVRLGLVPEAGSTLLLPNIVGQRRAFELLVEGRPFGAEQACEYGVINQVVAAESLVDQARKRATALAQLPETAVKLSKKCLKRAYLEQLHDTIDAEATLFAERLTSKEAQQAFMAFLQKPQ